MGKPTYRQLHHWITKGWLRPHGDGGTGHPYQWTRTEKRIASLMGRLVAAGITPARAAEYARAAVTASGEPLNVRVALGPGLALVVNDTQARPLNRTEQP